MGASPAALFKILLLAHGLGAAPSCTADHFQNWFRAASRGRLTLPGAVERQARQFRYVFVGGFQNERMPGYFAQNIKELRARGVPRHSIQTIFPCSHRTYEQNFAEIRSRFHSIAELGPEPLVVIAHSRGACETLAFALQDADFVGDRVRAIFLVQGPFGGTGVADYIVGDGAPLDRRMPPGHRLLFHLLGRLEKLLLKSGIHGGLRGLSREASRSFWSGLLARHADAIAIIGPRTFFIQSEIHPSRLHLAHGSLAWYLQTYYGPNDGMVAVSDQSLPDLGTNLGTLHVGHTALTHHFPATKAPRRSRRALMQSILMVVGQPGKDDPGR